MSDARAAVVTLVADVSMALATVAVIVLIIGLTLTPQ